MTAGTSTRPAAPAPVRSRVRGWPLLMPAVAVAAVCVTLHRSTGYTSDSTAQQSILRTWLSVGHGTTYVPSDTWLLKLPFYSGVEALPVPTTTRILLDVLAMNVLCLLLLAPAVWWLARHGTSAGARARFADVVLPLTWLATLGGAIGANRMQPNYRNIELGLAIGGLALVAAWLAGDREPLRHRGRTAAVIVAAALLWLDDPYFALLLAVPLTGAALAWWALRGRDPRMLMLAAGTTLSLALFAGLQRLLPFAGVELASGGTGLSLTRADLAARLRLLGPAAGMQLGVGDPGPLPAAAGLVAAAVAGLSVLAAVALGWHGWRRRNFLLCFLGLHWPVVVAGFLVSAHTFEPAHGRYLILALYDLVVALAVALPALRARRPALWRAAAGLLVAGIALNAGAALAAAGDEPADARRTQDVLAAIEAGDVRKGYAQFWSANLPTYRTEARSVVNSVRCGGGRLQLDLWLTDSARLDLPAGRTFFVWEPGQPAFAGCDEAGARNQLGAPARVLPAGPGVELWLYDADLRDRFDPSTHTAAG